MKFAACRVLIANRTCRLLLLLLQMRSVVARVMRDVQGMAPLPDPDPEALRMQYRPVGCWTPTCGPDP